jgi:ribose-phosphate pyrophosphokinase
MKPMLFALPGNETLTQQLSSRLGIEIGLLETRRFPDGETYVRVLTDISGRSVVMVCTLDQPDEKTLRLLFAARTARDLGASQIGLVAPYLGYMRQDTRFQAGEAITSTIYAQLLSSGFDWLVTVDPHLHRRLSLSEIYTIPTTVGHAATQLSAWIKAHVADALVIGPDAESEQWVRAVAQGAGVPWTTLKKSRHGDRNVEITLKDMARWRERRPVPIPVLVDDIISSGRTMEAAIKQLLAGGMPHPVVLGVHGLFAEDAFDRLKAAGADQVVSTNSVPHSSNGIDITDVLATAISHHVGTSFEKYVFDERRQH